MATPQEKKIEKLNETEVFEELEKINKTLEKNSKNISKLDANELMLLNKRRNALLARSKQHSQKNQDDFKKYWDISQRSVYNATLATAN